MKHFVKVLHGPDHAENAYRAISAVCTHDVKGKQVLLKVNTGFKAEPRSGICTSPDVVEGVIRYFREKGAGRILVGDSSIVGVDSLEALASAGIRDVCEKTGVECVDLNSFDPVDKKIPGGIMVDSILFSSAPFESDIVVSMPVMKTHMYTGATLSIKNMKGCMYKREKTKLHRLSKPLPPTPGDAPSTTASWTSQKSATPTTPSWTAPCAWRGSDPAAALPSISTWCSQAMNRRPRTLWR